MLNLKFLIFIMIFISSSPIIPVFLRVFLMVFLFLFLSHQNSVISNKLLLLTILFTISIFFSFLNDLYYLLDYGVNTYSFLYLPFSFILGLLFLNVFSFKNIMDNYSHVVLHLSVYSLIIYSVLLLFPSLSEYFFDYTYYETQHKTILIYNFVSSWRNSGFASEPGLFQFFVSIAAWWNMKNENDFKKNIIFLITLLSTFSTAGFISIVILLLFKSNKYTKLFLIIISIVFSALLYDLINYHLINKISFDSLAFQVRFIPLINSFYFILDNPLGVGSIKYTNIYEVLNIGSWESFGQLGVRYGITGILFVLLLLLSIARKDFGLFLIMFSTLLTQNIWFLPLCSILFGHYFLLNNSLFLRRRD